MIVYTPVNFHFFPILFKDSQLCPWISSFSFAFSSLSLAFLSYTHLSLFHYLPFLSSLIPTFPHPTRLPLAYLPARQSPHLDHRIASGVLPSHRTDEKSHKGRACRTHKHTVRHMRDNEKNQCTELRCLTPKKKQNTISFTVHWILNIALVKNLKNWISLKIQRTSDKKN